MRIRIIEPTKTITRKRVCAYARVSSESEAQGDSLENQTTYYKQLIESNTEYEFAGIFADYGLTGTKDDRPEFQKMLALAREHKIDRDINQVDIPVCPQYNDYTGSGQRTESLKCRSHIRKRKYIKF